MIPKHLEKNFITDVDGFVYYWVEESGSYSSANLREIADELDRRNKDWEKEITQYFNNSTPTDD